MEHIEQFTHLAEIAGVFVGFGALISIRSEATRDEEVFLIRAIVVFGILTVAVGLTPVVLNAFGIVDHGLWVASSCVFLVLWWGSGILDRYDRERARILAVLDHRKRMRLEAPSMPLWLSINAALVLILIGTFPDLEEALYLAAVTMNLFLTAGMLLYLVYLQRWSQPSRQEILEKPE